MTTNLALEPMIATGEPPVGRDQTFTIAASDLTFLWRDCQRCFYMKIVHGVRRPASIPHVFTVLDREQRRFFDGRDPTEVHPSLPHGSLLCDETTVLSAPLDVPGTDGRVRLRGILDCLAVFNDHTFGVIDFKTTEPRDKTAQLYRSQLHAYALALEHPESPQPPRPPVAVLGLMCFQPRGMARLTDKSYVYITVPAWIPIKRDDKWFYGFLGEVCDVLAADAPPPPSERCAWCKLE